MDKVELKFRFPTVVFIYFSLLFFTAVWIACGQPIPNYRVYGWCYEDYNQNAPCYTNCSINITYTSSGSGTRWDGFANESGFYDTDYTLTVDSATTITVNCSRPANPNIKGTNTGTASGTSAYINVTVIIPEYPETESHLPVIAIPVFGVMTVCIILLPKPSETNFYKEE